MPIVWTRAQQGGGFEGIADKDLAPWCKLGTWRRSIDRFIDHQG
jgi:hypothetical protein